MNRLFAIILFMIVLGCNHGINLPKEKFNQSGSANPKIDKALISFRIGVPL